jgi:hypothetical protein
MPPQNRSASLISKYFVEFSGGHETGIIEAAVNAAHYLVRCDSDRDQPEYLAVVAVAQMAGSDRETEPPPWALFHSAEQRAKFIAWLRQGRAFMNQLDSFLAELSGTVFAEKCDVGTMVQALAFHYWSAFAEMNEDGSRLKLWPPFPRVLWRCCCSGPMDRESQPVFSNTSKNAIACGAARTRRAGRSKRPRRGGDGD